PHLFSLFALPPSPPAALFPYTTLFRSPRPSPPSTEWAALGPAGAAVDSGRLVDRLVPALRRAARLRCPRCAGAPLFRTWTSMAEDRKSTRLNSSHQIISYAVFCLKKKI